jgi:hypothetical protein
MMMSHHFDETLLQYIVSGTTILQYNFKKKRDERETAILTMAVATAM